MNADEASLRERFVGEMTEGYLDGWKPDNPEPSENRSASYRHGFANGRDDLARSPRALAWQLRLMAEYALAEDVARASGSSGRLSLQHDRKPQGK